MGSLCNIDKILYVTPVNITSNSPYKWEIKSTSEQDIFFKIAISRQDRAVIMYKLKHMRNLAGFYQDTINNSDENDPISSFAEKNLHKTKAIIKILEANKHTTPISNVPDELLQLNDSWGWVKKGFGVKEGGLISNSYGITTSGICVQTVDRIVVAGCFSIINAWGDKFYENLRATNFIDALLMADGAFELLCGKLKMPYTGEINI
jgi:hypothetical protein